MRSSSLFALLALPAQLVLAQAPTQGAALSLDDAIRTAQQNNPTFLTFKNIMRNADAQLRSTHGALLPAASTPASARNTRRAVPSTSRVFRSTEPTRTTLVTSIGLSYNINAGLPYAPKAAKAQRVAADADITNQAEFLRAGITQQYILAAQGEALAAVLDTLVDRCAGPARSRERQDGGRRRHGDRRPDGGSRTRPGSRRGVDPAQHGPPRQASPVRADGRSRRRQRER